MGFLNDPCICPYHHFHLISVLRIMGSRQCHPWGIWRSFSTHPTGQLMGLATRRHHGGKVIHLRHFKKGPLLLVGWGVYRGCKYYPVIHRDYFINHCEWFLYEPTGIVWKVRVFFFPGLKNHLKKKDIQKGIIIIMNMKVCNWPSEFPEKKNTSNYLANLWNRPLFP